MTMTIGITQRIRIEFDIEDLEPLKSLFTKLSNYKKPAGYKHDGIDLTRQDRNYINEMFTQLSTITTNLNPDADE